MKDKSDYYYFPLGLLAGFIDTPFACCEDVLYWLMANDIAKMQGEINKKVIFDELKFCCEKQKFLPCGWRTGTQNADLLLEVYNRFANETNTCFVSLSKTYFKNIRKKGDNLTELERVVFLGYVALKSIEGRKRTVCKANNSLMFQRMTGNDYNSISDNFKKYSSTYYLKKIRDELQTQFSNIKIYATHTRGFYFTTRPHISRDKVVCCAFTAKKKYKESLLRKKNKESEERVKKSLDGVGIDDEASGNFFEKIKIEELHKELRPIYSEETQAANAIRQKILHEKNRMLEISELAKYFDKFKQKTIAEGETEMTRKEYQKHFANWLLKYIDIENQQLNKKPHSRKPDPYDRLKVSKPQNNGGGYWDR